MSGILLNIKSSFFNSSLATVKIAEKTRKKRHVNIANNILSAKQSAPDVYLKKTTIYNTATITKMDKYNKLAERIINIRNCSNQNQHKKTESNVKLKEEIIEHYGLYAEQYLDYPSKGFLDSETLALGLYTNGEYQSLNKKLRKGNELSKGDAMIHSGLTSSFERHSRNDSVLKTYRGSKGNDIFSQVAEGCSARDAGYLSTSRDLKTAKLYCGEKNGELSIIFGHSGIDVSHVSIEGDGENEVLYKNNVEMTVLFSGKDKLGVTQRVLHESTLFAETGTQKNLINALDIPVPFKKTD